MKKIGAISKKTGLPQTTYRLTGRTYSGRITEARGRHLVTALLPGDVIGLRPLGLGLKRTEHLNLADVYEIAFHARLRSERAQKLNFKKRGKK